MFNEADELLYVGISWQLPGRMKGHASEQPWWAEVDHATATWYDTREDADQAETEAIKAERPKYNRAKVATPVPKPEPVPRLIARNPDVLIKDAPDGRWIRVPPGVGVDFVYPERRLGEDAGWTYRTSRTVLPCSDVAR